MAKPKSSAQVFGFAIVICVVCSVILAGASTGLSERKKANAKLDVLKNILISVGHTADELGEKSPSEVIDMYQAEFEDFLFDSRNQPRDTEFMEQELLALGYTEKELGAMDVADMLGVFNAKLSLLKSRSDREQYDPGFQLVHIWKPKGEAEAYVIPIQGYGLWDIVKGYLALEPDLATVKGITFYEHKETPGLGARIEESWFKEQYVGKQIIDDAGNLKSVTIVRGKVEDVVKGDEVAHHVDGISGATLTGNGLNQFIKADLEAYEPFFKTLRDQSEGSSL